MPATGFAMPDLPDDWKEFTSYDGRWFSTNFSFAGLIDYNAFIQDSTSELQVGEQQDEWDTRSVRLMARGQFKFPHPIGYFLSLEVKGKDHVVNDASKIGFTDLEISTSLGRLGTLKFGKIKEPFAYEMVGDAANLQQQERGLNPFFASRGIGFRLIKPFADDSMTWSVGWFNDWWTQDQEFRESGNNFAGRFTGLPYYAVDGASYLHLGIGGRYIGEDEGTLRFRGRPESNVTDYFVDTGSIEGDHANQVGLESLWGHGPFLASGEYARAWVDATASGDPTFWGAYIVLSYVLTGEHRPYDKKVAYARRILPRRKSGAFELVRAGTHMSTCATRWSTAASSIGAPSASTGGRRGDEGRVRLRPDQPRSRWPQWHHARLPYPVPVDLLSRSQFSQCSPPVRPWSRARIVSASHGFRR